MSGNPGDVFAIEHLGPEHAAGWGGILSHGGKTRGLAGVILMGPVATWMRLGT